MKVLPVYVAFVLLACSAKNSDENKPLQNHSEKDSRSETVSRKFRGTFSNGMKGDSIFFNISQDGKRLENLTFKGYWRCNGRLESMLAGPDGSFPIENNRVSGNITEPPDGGSTAWWFELEADLKGSSASGNFRMAINNMGCDTYKLKWTASAY